MVFKAAGRHDWVVFIRCPTGYFGMVLNWVLTGSDFMKMDYKANKTTLECLEELLHRVDAGLAVEQRGCQLRLFIEDKLLQNTDYKKTLASLRGVLVAALGLH